MSETNTRESKLPAAAAASPAPGTVRPVLTAGDENGSFGRALAAAREARGLSQVDVAAQLRLHVRQVLAIEAEDLAALPEGPFVRGYVRNFAKLVDLPAEPLLSLLNAKLKPTDPLHAQVGGSAVSPIQRTPREPLSGRIVIAGVLVLLALLAVFGWWSMRADDPKPAAAAAAPAAAPAPVTAQPAQPAASEPAQATAAVGATSPPTDTPNATAPAVAVSGTELRFHFRDRSWVEVREADGTVLMSQNNAAGATKTVEGKPPYLVVIGNASKVELAFRGQPVDVASAIGRDDIARLRLE